MTVGLETRGDRRRFVVLLSVLALVASVFFGRLVFGQDDGDGNPLVTAVRPAARVTSRADAAANAKGNANATTRTDRSRAGDDLGSSDTFEVFETRDPFEPPIDVTPTTSPPATSDTTPPVTGGTTPTTSGTTPTTESPSFDPGRGQSVALLDVFDDASGTPQARVRVGSTVYTVTVGDTFATSYKVVSLDEPCGRFLFGDSPFQLCEGEETIK